MTDLDLSIVGTKTEDITFKYDWKDVVLYALGIGAKIDDLQFLYERYSGGLKVFPSYACIVAAAGLQLRRLGKINYSHFVHGEQSIKLYKPFSPSGKIICQGEVNNIYDKGKAAVIHMTVSGYNN